MDAKLKREMQAAYAFEVDVPAWCEAYGVAPENMAIHVRRVLAGHLKDSAPFRRRMVRLLTDAEAARLTARLSPEAEAAAEGCLAEMRAAAVAASDPTSGAHYRVVDDLLGRYDGAVALYEALGGSDPAALP